MSDTFSWITPPEHNRSEKPNEQAGIEARRQWVSDNLAKLKAKPGTWALVFEGSSSPTGGDIYKVLGCEVTARANFSRAKRTLDVYARWPKNSQPESVFVYQQDGIDHVISGHNKPKKRRGRPRLDACKRGHDLTAENARYPSGQCRKCKQQWKSERQQQAA